MRSSSFSPVSPVGGVTAAESGWLRTRLTLSVTLLLVAVCGSWSFAEPPPRDQKKSSPSDPPGRPVVDPNQGELDGEESPELEEILRLRRLMGDPFRGTLLESTGESEGKSGADQFAGALRKVVQEGSALHSPDFEGQAPSREQCEAWYQELLQGEPNSDRFVVPSIAAPPAPSPLSPAASPVASSPAARLRMVARQIGQSADDLEDLGRYSEADALREVAERLRKAARADQSMSFD